jgi:hypothetical protein
MNISGGGSTEICRKRNFLRPLNMCMDFYGNCRTWLDSWVKGKHALTSDAQVDLPVLDDSGGLLDAFADVGPGIRQAHVLYEETVAQHGVLLVIWKIRPITPTLTEFHQDSIVICPSWIRFGSAVVTSPATYLINPHHFKAVFDDVFFRKNEN